MRRGEKNLDSFKLGTVIGRFPSDDAVSMAVKRLNPTTLSSDCIINRYCESRSVHLFQEHEELFSIQICEGFIQNSSVFATNGDS